MSHNKTNASQLLATLDNCKQSWPIFWRLRAKARRMLTPGAKDDYDWSRYSTGYRAQFKWTSGFFSTDLGLVDCKWIDGRLYLLGDCKPVHPTHRCVWEAIGNLPDPNSVAEIGTGAGFLLVAIRTILGPTVRLSGYDLSAAQLRFFEELWSKEAVPIKTAILDLCQHPIPEPERPDVVFASTVLMHIQRPREYKAALRHFLLSAGRFAVLMDNWGAHDYFGDLSAVTGPGCEFERCRLYVYDSGANIAIVLSLDGSRLDAPYEALAEPGQLQKYLAQAIPRRGKARGWASWAAGNVFRRGSCSP